LNKEGKYVLKLDFKSPLHILAKFLIVLVITASTILLVKGSWFFPSIFLTIGVMSFLNFKLKEKKEITLLTNKILEAYKKTDSD